MEVVGGFTHIHGFGWVKWMTAGALATLLYRQCRKRVRELSTAGNLESWSNALCWYTVRWLYLKTRIGM